MPEPLWATPVRIRGHEIRNRIVFPPIGTSLAEPDGAASPEVLRWYEEIGAGGCGMVVVEGTAVAPEGKGCKRNLSIYDRRQLEGLRKIARSLLGHGAFASIQLLHAGGQANPEFTGREALSPSDLPPERTGTGHSSRALRPEEIAVVRECYLGAARAARDAGFPAVELHLAHGYLLHQFLSAHTNRRTDGYGGALENRARLVLEIIQGIRKECPELVLGARVSGEDYLPDGIRPEVNAKLLPMLESAGLEYFSVTAGIYETSKAKHAAMSQGEFFAYSRGIKRMVGKPVIGVGKILDLDSAEKHLQAGDCDMVAIGRGLIADPQMVVKTKAGRAYNRCTECGECRYLALGRESLTCPFRDFH